MNEGISFEEACKVSPNGLTEQQLQNCPAQESKTIPHMYVGVVGALILLFFVLVVAARLRRSKKPS